MTTVQHDQATEVKHSKRIVFFIDGVKFETGDETLTVRAILVSFAHEDPALTTLVLVHGKDREKYDSLDTVIHLKDGMKFAVLHNGPTTVS